MIFNASSDRDIPRPVILALETAAPAGGVALAAGGEIRGEHFHNSRVSHTARILASVDAVVKEAGLKAKDLDAIGVAQGPGSFTALRVGLATAQGLALTLKIPLIGVSSWETLVAGLGPAALPICVMIYARRSEVFAALFKIHDDGNYEELRPPVSSDPEDCLRGLSAPTLFVGSGAVYHRELIEKTLKASARFASPLQHFPRPGATALVAAQKFAAGEARMPASVLPLYLRRSDAEINCNQY